MVDKSLLHSKHMDLAFSSKTPLEPGSSKCKNFVSPGLYNKNKPPLPASQSITWA